MFSPHCRGLCIFASVDALDLLVPDVSLSLLPCAVGNKDRGDSSMSGLYARGVCGCLFTRMDRPGPAEEALSVCSFLSSVDLLFLIFICVCLVCLWVCAHEGRLLFLLSQVFRSAFWSLSHETPVLVQPHPPGICFLYRFPRQTVKRLHASQVSTAWSHANPEFSQNLKVHYFLPSLFSSFPPSFLSFLIQGLI